MADDNLKARLQSIVDQYGIDRVTRSLREIHFSEDQPLIRKKGKPSTDAGVDLKAGRRPPKVAAGAYVAKMALPVEKEALMRELAKRFEDKSFLPTFGDVRNFCRLYGVDEPASKSRKNAVPRIFKFMVTMKTDEIREILHGRMFSGPSRLGPIADAIRSHGRVATRGSASARDSSQNQNPSERETDVRPRSEREDGSSRDRAVPRPRSSSGSLV